MKYSEDTLRSWTVGLSETEEQRADNAISMIQSAIEDNEELNDMKIEVFVQGSYANDTNVRTESDVDVCVMLKSVFHGVYPYGLNSADYGFSSAELTFEDYRSLIKRALQNKFKSDNVHDGNKSLKIDENTYHVKADVVPAFQFRNYRDRNGRNPSEYIEGIWLSSKTGTAIINYPKIHIENGRIKDEATNHAYKKLVRIMKRIKNNMVDDRVTDGDVISSFLIECLIWNTPDRIVDGYTYWTSTVQATIGYLYKEIEAGRHVNWKEVSGMLYLFKDRKWTAEDVKQWLYDAWNYLGCGR